MSMAPAESGTILGGDSPEEIAADIGSVGSFEALPLLLQVVCRATGMGFAAVVRMTENTWTACAVKDDIGLGLTGGQPDARTILGIEPRAAAAPIAIDDAGADPRYRDYPVRTLHRIESYVSVPIVTAGGRRFGSLCAVDTRPRRVSDPKIIGIFEGLAGLLALHLEGRAAGQQGLAAVRDERVVTELREQFAAILGHDLRNALQAVFSGSALLQRKLSDPALQLIAGRIKTGATRMSGLINDVLDFIHGRLGGGIAVEMRNMGDIGERLLAVVQGLQAANPKHPILAQVDVPGMVRCDPGRMQQLASHLIGNALMHGSLEQPVQVAARIDGGCLILQVWNAGEPIPEESVARIFEPFWRRGSAQDRQRLGLGLFMSAQIVRAHQGTIKVTSTKEHGTQVTVLIPLQG